MNNLPINAARFLCACALMMHAFSFAAVTVNAKTFLGGAATSATAMRTSLQTSGFLPFTDPYGLGVTVLGFPANTVDWIKVDLISAIPGSGCNFVSSAAFLLSDGSIVGTDGAPLNVNVAPGNYQIRVIHRNHGALISAVTPLLAAGSTLMDMTNAANLVNLGNTFTLYGIRTAIFGNANGDNQIDFPNDSAAILARLGGDQSAIRRGYFQEDVNLDGVLRYSGSGNDPAKVSQAVGGDQTAVVLIPSTLPAGSVCALALNAVPTLSQVSLALMALLLAAFGWLFMRNGYAGSADRRNNRR